MFNSGEVGVSTRVALLDLDDTLIDRSASFRRWATEFCAGHGIGQSEVDLICEIDNHGWTDRVAMISVIASVLGLGEDGDALVAASYQHRFAHYLPFAGVKEALAQLGDAGVLRVVVTNGPETQHRKLANAGLAGSVDSVICSHRFGLHKPNPGILHEAMRISSAQPGECVMIGDDPVSDVIGATTVGISSTWVSHGRKWPLRTVFPDRIAVSAPEAIRAIIRQFV